MLAVLTMLCNLWLKNIKNTSQTKTNKIVSQKAIKIGILILFDTKVLQRKLVYLLPRRQNVLREQF